jgi:SAM-dependent methyltransferase
MNNIVSSDKQKSKCLVCGRAQSKLRFTYHGYHVMNCLDCGLEYVSPTPSASELAAHYKKNYAVSLEKYAASRNRNIARLVELEIWCPKRGRLLEVGSAYGHSLELARNRGWEVTGVELSSEAAAYARQNFGLTVFDCDLTEAPLTSGVFDAVIMWHVLEHSRDPKEQLSRVAALLKSDGIVGIRVPNISSFGARVTGEWWPWMCPPAHLWFFSSTTLPRLLRDCGFEVMEVRTLRGDGNNLYQYALIWSGSQLNKLRHIVHSREQRERPTGEDEPAKQIGSPMSPASSKPSPPSGVMGHWLRILTRAQPFTNALARGTRPLLEPLERRGWGDELLVYARRID